MAEAPPAHLQWHDGDESEIQVRCVSNMQQSAVLLLHVYRATKEWVVRKEDGALCSATSFLPGNERAPLSKLKAFRAITGCWVTLWELVPKCQWWPAIKSRHPLEMLVETVTRLRHVEATNTVLQNMVLQQAKLVVELRSSHKQQADSREASDEMDAVASLQLLAKQQQHNLMDQQGGSGCSGEPFSQFNKSMQRQFSSTSSRQGSRLSTDTAVAVAAAEVASPSRLAAKRSRLSDSCH